MWRVSCSHSEMAVPLLIMCTGSRALNGDAQGRQFRGDNAHRLIKKDPVWGQILEDRTPEDLRTRKRRAGGKLWSQDIGACLCMRLGRWRWGSPCPQNLEQPCLAAGSLLWAVITAPGSQHGHQSRSPGSGRPLVPAAQSQSLRPF